MSGAGTYQKRRAIDHLRVRAWAVILWRYFNEQGVGPLRPLLIALIAALPLSAMADEVTDVIKEAMEAYEDGDLAYAKESLEYAATLIGQQKTAGLSELLPAALEGWTAEDDTDAAAGMAVLGGSAAKRIYRKGDAQVEIQFLADSPLVAQMGIMVSNPQVVTSSGGKLMRFGRQKAVLTRDGEIMFLVDNRILVQITGSAAEDDRIAYAKAIDIRALSGF